MWCCGAYCGDPLATVPHLCSPVQHHAKVLVISGIISLSNSQYYGAAHLWLPVPGLAQSISNSEVSALNSIRSLGLQQLILLSAPKWSRNNWQGSSESLTDSLPLGLSGKEEEFSLTWNSILVSVCSLNSVFFSHASPCSGYCSVRAMDTFRTKLKNLRSTAVNFKYVVSTLCSNLS